MRIVLCAFVLAAGCGESVDCPAYADRVAEIGAVGLTGADHDRATVLSRYAALEVCKGGGVTSAEAKCVIAARTSDHLLACALIETAPKGDKKDPAQTSAAIRPAAVAADPKIRMDARAVLEKACGEKDAVACYNVGMRFWRGQDPNEDLPADPAAAHPWLGKACELEYTQACVIQALLIGQGTGVAADQAKAVEIFRRACDIGDAEACYHASNRAYLGKGVAVDLAAALALSTRACEGGYGEACKNVAVLYNKGEGVAVDAAKAIEFLEKACTLDDKFCGELAHNLHKQGGAEPARITSLMRRACEGGDKAACSALAPE